MSSSDNTNNTSAFRLTVYNVACNFFFNFVKYNFMKTSDFDLYLYIYWLLKLMRQTVQGRTVQGDDNWRVACMALQLK